MTEESAESAASNARVVVTRQRRTGRYFREELAEGGSTQDGVRSRRGIYDGRRQKRSWESQDDERPQHWGAGSVIFYGEYSRYPSPVASGGIQHSPGREKAKARPLEFQRRKISPSSKCRGSMRWNLPRGYSQENGKRISTAERSRVGICLSSGDDDPLSLRRETITTELANYRGTDWERG